MTHYSSSHSHKMVWIRLISLILYKNKLTSKFAGFLKMLILTDYFSFLNITLSYKNSHQLGQNQPTDKFHHSIESWEHGEEDRTWAGGLRRLWRPPKRRNISLPNSLATVVPWFFEGPQWVHPHMSLYLPFAWFQISLNAPPLSILKPKSDPQPVHSTHLSWE